MDIVFRAAIGFFFLYFLTRVIGRRELSSMEPFDLVLLVVVGDLVQQGITQSDYSLVGLVTAASTMALLTVAVSLISFRFPRIRPILDGEPIVVVRAGQVIEENLTRERLTVDEIRAEARLQNIASLGDVEWAILETSGKISFIAKSG
jgi:uncharacterized membrane protein YcaP (DUF421 family)